MKRLSLALALWLGLVSATFAQSVGPTNQVLCNKMAVLAVGATSITQVVTPISLQSIYVCGWHVTNTGATGTYSLSYGTGTNCGTGTTTWTPNTNVTNTAPDVDHIDYAIAGLPASAALCVTFSVNTVSTLIFYSQF
jgi:hypothetical protein